MSEKKVLIANFLSLSGVQIASYVFPLLTIPYLVRVLGPEKYGVIALSQAVMQYLTLITEYGFNFSATKAIAINREDKDRVAEIFQAVMTIKVVLMVACFGLLLLLLATIELFRKEWLVYLLTFGTVAGNVLFPLWFFQGMEWMRQMAIINILAQMLFTILVFTVIKSTHDYVYIPAISSCCSIVSGVISLVTIHKRFGIKLTPVNANAISIELKNGWHIFLTSMIASIFNNSNTLVLGFFTSNSIVGYYSAGEKVICAVKGILGPLSQTLYPHFSKLAFISQKGAIAQINKATKLVGAPFFLISLSVLFFADDITKIVLGNNFAESKHVIQILSFLPFVIALSNLFTIQGLYNFGFQAVVSKFTMFISLFHIVSVAILTYAFSFQGTAAALLASETLIALSSYYFYKKLLPGQ